MERYEDAVTELRNAVDAPGAPVEARALLEQIYLQLDRRSDLKALYEDALEKLPNDPYWLTQASAFALQTGDYNKAIDYIDKCLRNTELTDAGRVDLIVKKGNVLTDVYERTSDKNYLKAAITEYESLLAKMPNNIRVVTVLNNLAYWLAETDERLSDALSYAKRALELEPKRPGTLDTYAFVLLKSGNVSEADRYLTEALQRFEQNRIPVPAEVYEHKGMIKERLGEKQQARAAYEEALNVGEKSLSEKAKKRIERAVARISP
jgi:tetratricopeptide (TPR) repeat protein